MAAIICTLVILLAIIFFVWVPGFPVNWKFTIPVVIGVCITMTVGEVLIRNKKHIDQDRAGE